MDQMECPIIKTLLGVYMDEGVNVTYVEEPNSLLAVRWNYLDSDNRLEGINSIIVNSKKKPQILSTRFCKEGKSEKELLEVVDGNKYAILNSTIYIDDYRYSMFELTEEGLYVIDFGRDTYGSFKYSIELRSTTDTKKRYEEVYGEKKDGELELEDIIKIGFQYCAQYSNYSHISLEELSTCIVEASKLGAKKFYEKYSRNPETFFETLGLSSGGRK